MQNNFLFWRPVVFVFCETGQHFDTTNFSIRTFSHDSYNSLTQLKHSIRWCLVMPVSFFNALSILQRKSFTWKKRAMCDTDVFLHGFLLTVLIQNGLFKVQQLLSKKFLFERPTDSQKICSDSVYLVCRISVPDPQSMTVPLAELQFTI